ncbi:MAG: HAD-IC family P-type ATPase [Kiritimatiellae bacterium]|nr:HAD-IC family P-type ATPase [Kiritimatiellia bacterium]
MNSKDNRRFSVTGMTCAACSARVERAVAAVPGVAECSVSLLTNEMSVAGNATDEAIVAAVEKAGYGAMPQGRQVESQKSKVESQRSKVESQAAGLRGRLIASLALLAILMYATMGHMMLGWPLPRWFTQPEPNHVAMGLAQLLLSGAVLVLNQRFFTSGFRAALRGAPNMDTLVALGAGAAYAWSVAVLFLMTRAQVLGGTAAAEAWMGQYYFESAAMIVTLISVGKLLEERAKGRTTSALAALVRLAPKTAAVIRDSREVQIPAAQVRVGDLFLVRRGMSIPVDGVVEEGEGAVDESMLTGESVPVAKAPGAAVSAATTNLSGFMRCRATRVGEDTTLAQIVRLMRDAAATKAPIARLADRAAAIFVPAILLIAIVTLGVWLIAGAAPGFALARAISVLVVSCPCALGLATPVAIMVGCGVGARRGILFKNAAALEAAGRAEIVVLDKTGTVTTGKLDDISGAVVADAPRPEAAEAIRDLRGMGLRVMLLSGDKEDTAKAIAGAVGIDDVIAGVLPDGKHGVVEDLKKRGRVAMVGDGVNDAPALAAADLGLAIGAGTDVAIDAAGAVLVHSRLTDVPAALRLGHATLRNIRENLFWAFFYNALLIPLAAGAFYPLFGWKMHPDLGALAMSLSSFCVVANALRLNLAKLGDAQPEQRKEATMSEEKKNDKRVLAVQGMMCAHCEAHVRKALEAVPGVASATADHEKGVAEVVLSAPVDDAALVAAVKAAGYEAAPIL